MELQEREPSFTKGETAFIHVIQASNEVDKDMKHQVTLKIKSEGGKLAQGCQP